MVSLAELVSVVEYVIHTAPWCPRLGVGRPGCTPHSLTASWRTCPGGEASAPSHSAPLDGETVWKCPSGRKCQPFSRCLPGSFPKT